MNCVTMEKKKKCYNSGKISGLSTLAATFNFRNADKEIRSMGYEPVNPIEERWINPSSPWLFHLIVDIWHILWCRSVYFQKNWTDSRGARIEFYIALCLNKEMIMQE